MSDTVVVDPDTDVIVVTSAPDSIIVQNDAALVGPQGQKGDQGDPPDVSVYNQSSLTISAGVLTINCASATSFFVPMDQNVTSVVLQNRPEAGKSQRIAIYTRQDNNGSRTITGFPAGTKWPLGLPPTLSVEATAEDCMVLDIIGNTAIYGTMVSYKYA